MQLSSNLNDGLVETLNRLCGTTVNTYSYKAKIVDLNSALDWYFDLAEKSTLQWNKDDSTQVSPPIDTQDIVSGTNRYKLSAFADEITELLKLEVLTSAGTGQKLFPDTLDSYGNLLGVASGQIGNAPNTFQERYLNAPAGTPTNYIKYGDFIYLYPSPNYNKTAGLKAYFNRPASKFNFVSATVTIAAPGVFTSTAHGLALNDTVILETDGALPTGLAVDTQYYVVSGGLTADAFELSATKGGTAITTTGSQSGNHSFLKTNVSPGINTMHHTALVDKAAQKFMLYNNTSGVYNSRLSVLNPQVQTNERMVEAFYSNRGRDLKQKMVSRRIETR